MTRTRAVPLTATLLALLLAGCGSAVDTADEMNASYERALERSAATAVELPGGIEGARATLARAEAFFSDLSPEALQANVPAVYAPDAYLNDNIAVIEGAGAIAEYFGHTGGRVTSLRVSFLDASQAGRDYFVRWRMTVVAPRLNGAEPMISYGMTHFRFDAEGRILVHKDFWDAGTGLYEYLPGLGRLLRQVRAAAL